MGLKQKRKGKTQEQEVNGFVVMDESEVYNMDAFKGGMDFYLQGGKSEAESVTKHLRSLKGVAISKERYEQFQNIEQPPQPDFEVKTLEQVRALDKRERKDYKEKMDAFEKRRKKWEKTDAGKAWTKMLNETTDALQSQNEAYRLAEKSGYKDIEADPDIMDEKLEETDTDEFVKKDEEISRIEILAAKKMNAAGYDAIGWYTEIASGEMNYYMRTGELRENGRGQEVAKWAENAKNFLKNASLSRDIVSRRTVKDAQTVGFMLGLKNAQSMTPDEIKAELKHRIGSGDEVMLEEKGFCSTSVSSGDPTYYAGDRLHDDSIGVEFIILNKKGTRGINFTRKGSVYDEHELLLAPGTKFRLVEAYFNDGEKGQKRSINYGTKKSWKIYLETVPDNGARIENGGGDEE